MATRNEHFRRILDYLGMTNLSLAKALNMDPSIISRYLSGQRRLLASSPQLEAVADFILSHSQRIQDMEWLKEQFALDGLPTDISTVYRFKQNLIIWLATDGDKLRKNLGASLPGDIAGSSSPEVRLARPQVLEADRDIKVGCLEIVLALRPALSALPDRATVDIFLSSDQIATIVNPDLAALLMEMVAHRDLSLRIVVCVSSNTQAMSRLLDTYMPALVTGHIILSVVHGMTQTVNNTMQLIIPNSYVLLVTETAGNAPPIAMEIRSVDFVAETEASFDIAARYAQPVLNLYGDDFSRNILEILYMEFCTPGALDIVKDSINPLYMPAAAYNRFLAARRHSPEEYAWRSAEFARFKSNMDQVLAGGSCYREILSLNRLNDIAQRGVCRLPGLYFMERGYLDLDTEGCLAILNGYAEYLENTPNFQLLILDDLTILHQNNCWHLKQNQSLAINYWSGREPMMVHSNQLMLLREFQTHFDRLWAQGKGAIGSRAHMISILRDVVSRLEKRRPE